jgi:thimet oligopeptidase
MKFVEITAADGAKHRTWHDDVRQFEARDAATDAPLGTFFLDLYPREGKYGHAAVFPLISTCHDDNGVRVPYVF